MNNLELIELAKLGLQMYFQTMRMSGKTEEEIKAYIEKVRTEFFKRSPEDLKKV